jgi:hypothetical protein
MSVEEFDYWRVHFKLEVERQESAKKSSGTTTTPRGRTPVKGTVGKKKKVKDGDHS